MELLYFQQPFIIKIHKIIKVIVALQHFKREHIKKRKVNITGIVEDKDYIKRVIMNTLLIIIIIMAKIRTKMGLLTLLAAPFTELII